MAMPVMPDGKVVVRPFYNSWDGLYHRAEYIPYQRPPTVYVCGKTGNFSPTAATGSRAKCPQCWADVKDD